MSTAVAAKAEVPLAQSFAMLANGEFCDVSLRANDGVLIPANSMALSVRSGYFKSLFQKRRSKQGKNTGYVVPMGLSSNILLAIVEYIHTDTPSILREMTIDARSTGKPTIEFMKKFQELLPLTEAAISVGLPGLYQKVQFCLSSILAVCPGLTFAILAASKQEGPAISRELEKQARKVVGSVIPVPEALNEIVLGGIDVDTLRAILQDIQRENKLDVLGIDFLLSAWSESNPSIPDETKEHRLDEAKSLMHHVELGCWPLQWKHTGSHIFASGIRWNSDCLDFVCGLGGTYQWTVNTDATSNKKMFGSHIWLGVMKKKSTGEDTISFDIPEYCGQHTDCWGICGPSSDRDGPLSGHAARLFGKNGSRNVITMSLDLSDNNRSNGSLSISVDRQQSIRVVSNLRAHLEGAVGFVPAVSCMFASVNIVSFRKLKYNDR